MEVCVRWVYYVSRTVHKRNCYKCNQGYTFSSMMVSYINKQGRHIPTLSVLQLTESYSRHVISRTDSEFKHAIQSVTLKESVT